MCHDLLANWQDFPRKVSAAELAKTLTKQTVPPLPHRQVELTLWGLGLGTLSQRSSDRLSDSSSQILRFIGQFFSKKTAPHLHHRPPTGQQRANASVRS